MICPRSSPNWLARMLCPVSERLLSAVPAEACDIGPGVWPRPFRLVLSRPAAGVLECGGLSGAGDTNRPSLWSAAGAFTLTREVRGDGAGATCAALLLKPPDIPAGSSPKTLKVHCVLVDTQWLQGSLRSHLILRRRHSIHESAGLRRRWRCRSMNTNKRSRSRLKM